MTFLLVLVTLLLQGLKKHRTHKRPRHRRHWVGRAKRTTSSKRHRHSYCTQDTNGYTRVKTSSYLGCEQQTDQTAEGRKIAGHCLESIVELNFNLGYFPSEGQMWHYVLGKIYLSECPSEWHLSCKLCKFSGRASSVPRLPVVPFSSVVSTLDI